ncbi:hypothetical protein FB45DRAFT_1111973 [Roridomyces roridus]|uniref:Uncharacterized protein n=1 Tax=Roridomyces roridus TaxID=1738132 RepID=A0AAD7B8A7_9AGAR|nr:hypothetical protein FB45DRAFT_1111973 [Roridomyces roridus]
MGKNNNKKRKWFLTGSDEPPENAYTPAVVKKLNMGPKALAEYEAEQARRSKEEWQDMSQSSRNKMHVLANLFEDENFDPEAALAQGIPTLDDILDGSARAEFSHAGGDLDDHDDRDEEDGLFEDGIEEEHRQRSRRKDWRTRRDRTVRRTDAFKIQMRYMVAAYSRYTAGEPVPEPTEQERLSPETFSVLVVDLFGISRFVTWMQDERAFLLAREAALRLTVGKSEDEVEADRVLTFHIAEYRNRRGRFDALHMDRLQQLRRRFGGRFTGSLEPGKAINGVEADVSDVDMLGVEEEDALLPAAVGEMEEDHGSEDEGDDAHDEQVSEMIYQLAGLGVDADQREEASEDLY